MQYRPDNLFLRAILLHVRFQHTRGLRGPHPPSRWTASCGSTHSRLEEFGIKWRQEKKKGRDEPWRTKINVPGFGWWPNVANLLSILSQILDFEVWLYPSSSIFFSGPVLSGLLMAGGRWIERFAIEVLRTGFIFVIRSIFSIKSGKRLKIQ